MRKRSVLFAWSISYAVLLLLLIFLCFIINAAARWQLITEYKEISINVQKKAGLRMDEFLTEAETRSVNIATDLSVTEFARLASPDKPDYYYLIPIQRLLGNHLLYAENVEELCVYFPSIDRIISDKTIYQKSYYIDRIARQTNISRDQAEDLLDSPHYRTVLPLFGDDGTCQRIFLLNSVPIASAYPNALVIQNLEITALDQIMQNYSIIDHAALFLVNREGEIIRQAGSSGTLEALCGYRQADYREESFRLNGETYWQWKEPMNHGDWTFITVIPNASIADKTSWLIRQGVAVLSVILMAGAILSVIMIRINYRPLKKLKEELSTGGSLPANEYELIDYALRDMRDDYTRVSQLSEWHSLKNREQFLQSLLFRSARYDLQQSAELMSHLGLVFIGEFFQVAAFELPEGIDLEQDRQFQEELILVLEEMRAGRPDCLLLPVTGLDYYAVLLNFENENLSAKDLDMAGRIKELQSGYSDYGVDVCVSRVYRGMERIELAWAEVCERLQQLGESGGEAEPPEPEQRIIMFPDSQRELLVRYVCAGNQAEAAKLLDEIFAVNYSTNLLSPSLSRCLCYDIVNSICKGAGTLAGHPVIRSEVESASRQLNKQDNREQMRETVYSYAADISLICGQSKNRDKSKAVPIAEVLLCVETHFREHDFNVSRAAGYLNMNVTYLSKHFKQQTGVGLLSYINGVRINYAKELMQSGKITVARAAEQSGFENPNTFIRLFKKYEGETPGIFLNNF